MRAGGVVLVGLFCWGFPWSSVVGLSLYVFCYWSFVVGLSLFVFPLVFRYWTCMSFSLSLYFYGFFVVSLF